MLNWKHFIEKKKKIVFETVTLKGSRYSRMGQVKLVEDNLKKFFTWSISILKSLDPYHIQEILRVTDEM